ncbi:hypothetical protein PBY51_000109 [Eleginops maclovinus]|uniref:Uncharacterized protein n=1 Tax=Eleginops maclovinus TaxID=56733 RepID=A0AAN8AHP4_ELEMC|nr:hypothetical protein PBY51_000109 [Eleginops maclovinus]
MNRAISEPTVPQALGRLRVIHSALQCSELLLFFVTSDHPISISLPLLPLLGVLSASRQGPCDERRKERGEEDEGVGWRAWL